VPVALPDAQVDETRYALSMLRAVRAEGHGPRLPKSDALAKQGRDEVGEAILAVLVGEMTPSEISHAVTARLCRRVWPQTINDRLRGKLKERGLVESRELGPRARVWRKCG
jgi:DNA-binding transcriptional ArsR family regulator